jgi:hypothetical protein
MTHGEKWQQRKESLIVSDGQTGHFLGLGSRNGPLHIMHYKLKIWAAFALDGVIKGQDAFDAVEVFALHCELNGYENTLRSV